MDTGWLDIAMLAAALAAAGALTGLAAGLRGTGGGVVLVPVLFYVLHSVGQAGAGLFQVALGTALGALGVMSARALRAQAARGAVDWALLRRWGPFAAIGAAIGGTLMARAAPGTAMAAYGLAALVAGLGPAFLDARTRLAARMYGGPRGAALAVALGAVSGGAGLGGGAFGAPLLRLCGVPDARATAAGLGVAIAVPAALAFAAMPPAGAVPPFSLGAVNLPGVAAIALTAGFCAPYGTRIAQAVPTRLVTFGFGFFLAVTGLSMLRAGLSG